MDEKKNRTEETRANESRKKPTEIVGGYDPSLSFADIMDSFNRTGDPYAVPKGKKIGGTRAFGEILKEYYGVAEKKSNKTEIIEEKKVIEKKSVIIEESIEEKEKIEEANFFRTPEKDEDDKPGNVSWSIFGGKNDDFVRTEQSEEGERRPKKEKVEKAASVPFSEILEAFEKKQGGLIDKAFEEIIKEMDSKPAERVGISRLRHMGPEVVLDLHGYVLSDAVKETESFLSECRNLGIKKISIITGRGNHSEGEPVLRPEIERLIKENPNVREMQTAPHNAGGSGAFWIILKS